VRRKRERKVEEKNGTARDEESRQAEVGKKNLQNDEKRDRT
jgi:hypothetical protein